MLHNFDILEGFLSINPQINNKLACLVRELQNLPHLKVVYCAYASLGIHLIEPFHATTIRTGTTHSMLAMFYKGLYSCLSTKTVDADFLNFSSPFFPGVSENLFKNIKESYGKEVVQSVMEQGQEQVDDVLFLINSMLPDLARCLAKEEGLWIG